MGYYAVINGELGDQIATNSGLSTLYDALEQHGGDECQKLLDAGESNNAQQLLKELETPQTDGPLAVVVAGIIAMISSDVTTFGV